MNLNLLSGSKAPLWNTIAIIIELLMIVYVWNHWGSTAGGWMAIGSIAWYFPYTICRWFDRRSIKKKEVVLFKESRFTHKKYNPRLGM